MVLASPAMLPMLLVKNRRFKRDIIRSHNQNKERIACAEPLALPALTHFELTVLVEQKAMPGFLSSPGVSYLIKTNLGSLLFDLGYGPEMPSLAHNAKKIGFGMEQVDGLAISHLHPDHMGRFKAVREKQVTVPPEIRGPDRRSCFLPVAARAEGFNVHVVDGPRIMTAGIASTGALARSLFLMWTEKQALVARLKDKGLVVFTGGGHPTIETIIQMVRRLSDEPVFAIGGGLHYAIGRLKDELTSGTRVLRAGVVYRL